MPPLIRLIILPVLALALESCTSSLENKIRAQDKMISDLINLHRVALEEQRQYSEYHLRRLSEKINCRDESARYFVKECESSFADGCSAQNLAAGLTFMDKYPYATMYLRPGQGVSGINAIRRGQMLELTNERVLFINTKFLIIVQPRGENPTDFDEAEKLGKQVLSYFQTQQRLASWVRILGPKILPSKLKREQTAPYRRRIDMPQGDEPTDPSQVVRVWIFRTEC